MWEELLCYQFHDMLPGSSARQVYVELEESYACLADRASARPGELLGALAETAPLFGHVVYHIRPGADRPA